MNDIIRVCCLYRVSTNKQLEKDDIPMQKQCCREFVAERAHLGWTIVKEISEKGVSGFKVSAQKRDAIIEIQEEAAQGNFDVLLVYMFDRLGRKDDETPFVVEWFVRNGIQVWSTVEGEQKFENHADKLVNYIRYWQASGESIKTSIRTKTRLSQIVQEGRFRGGKCPYGYRLCKNGRYNRKNQEVYDIEIDEKEAAVVKLIFRKYVYEGYGAQRLCKYLLEQGILNRKGMNFVNTTVQHMLKNIMYLGILRSGESQSDIFPNLQIIDVETFERAEQIRKGRTQKHSDVPLNCKGRALLAGKLYCGHCGSKLVLSTSGSSYVKADGTCSKTIRLRYQCHNKVRHPQLCDGQSAYGVVTLDQTIEEAISRLFEEIKTVPQEEMMQNEIMERRKECETQLSRAKKASQACEKEYADYKAEVQKIIRGESILSSDMLNDLLEDCKKSRKKAEQEVIQWQKAAADKTQQTEKLERLFGKVLTWSEMFGSCSLDEKKMILSQLIHKIHIWKDNQIEIEFNIHIQQILAYKPKNRLTK